MLELGSFGFCGAVEAQAPYLPAAREVCMGKNMSAREPNNERQNSPSKYYITALERKVSLGTGMVCYTWICQGKFTMLRHGDHI